jgi:hypothetical protein
MNSETRISPGASFVQKIHQGIRSGLDSYEKGCSYQNQYQTGILVSFHTQSYWSLFDYSKIKSGVVILSDVFPPWFQIKP